MKRLILCVAVVVVLVGISEQAVAVIIVEDFSGGIQPQRWDILRRDAAGAPWTVTAPDSFGGLQLSKAADSDPLLYSCVGGIASRFQLIGDFSVAVDFNLVDFPEPNTSGWNEAILRVGFSGTPFFADLDFFEILRYTESNNAQKQWVLGWSSQPPPYSAFGLAPDPTLQGSFSITRSGGTLSAWIDRGEGPVLVGSETSTMFTGLANIQLVALQQPGLTFPRPSTSLDVRFDNLVVEADSITVIPEPSSLIVWSLIGLTFGGVGWWQRRSKEPVSP